jgi:hypothetical protein
MKWEYLRVSVYHKDNDKLDFVAKKEKSSPSIATHDGMEGHFNVEQNDWQDFLQKLNEEGWELINVYKHKDGWQETFNFKRSKD